MREFTEETVLEINKLLGNGASLNKLDKEGTLGRSRKAFCNAAKKLGYTFNKEKSAFERDVTDATQDVTEVVEQSILKENKDTKTKKTTIAELEKRIELLEDAVFKLQNSKNITTDSFQALELDPRTASDIVSRSIKVSKEAIKLFDFIAENKYPQHSKQALLSQALIEFYEKHK